MGKGAQTRKRIVAEAAVLFNQRGFSGASLTDVMAATGLEKGGIYRHFDSKEALALAAFDYAVGQVGERLRGAAEEPGTPLDRLHRIVTVFTELASRPAIPGGCPIINAAVENDDGNAALLQRSRAAMDRLLGRIASQIEAGQVEGEVAGSVDPAATASVMVSLLEGGLILSRMYNDRRHAAAAEQHLHGFIEQNLRTGAPTATAPRT